MKDQALINRLGFNNHGSEIVSKRIVETYLMDFWVLILVKQRYKKRGRLLFMFIKVICHAGYITINISSPNTARLRKSKKENLETLLSGINKIKKDKRISKPIAVKLSPDINESEISTIIELMMKYKIKGIIVSNTTDNNRTKLEDSKKNEIGGLSGQPLRDISTNLIKKFYKETKGKMEIIGVGGVDLGKISI